MGVYNVLNILYNCQSTVLKEEKTINNILNESKRHSIFSQNPLISNLYLKF